MRRDEWSVTHQRFPVLSHSTHRPFFLPLQTGHALRSALSVICKAEMWSVGRVYNT